MVPVDYSYQWKKEVSGTFPFTCPVTALPVFYRRRWTLCSLHLVTRFTSHNLYLRCPSLASRAKRSFNFGPPKINGSTSKLSLLWLNNLEKNGKELWRYKHNCFILSFWLLSFNGVFAPYNRTWKNVFIICYHKRRRHTKQNSCPVPCSLVVYIFLVILFSFVVLAISNYFQSHCFLRFFLLLSIFSLG